MSSQSSKILTTAISALLVATAWSAAARADDSEIFNVTAVSSSNPNVLFILDTSGSMGSAVYSRPPYDPKTTYPTNWGPTTCSTDSIYFKKGASAPTCSSSSFAASNLVCSTAKASLLGDASQGYYGGDKNGDNAIAWLKSVVTTTASTEPGTRTSSRTVTASKTLTVTMVETHLKVVKVSGGAVVSDTITKTTNTSSTSSTTTTNGAWSTPTTSMSGTVTTGSPSDVTTYQWTTNLVQPAASSTTTPTTKLGSTTTTTAAGTWLDGTPQITGPNKSAEAKSGGTYSGGTLQNYTYTITTVTKTPQTKVDTQTQATPVTATSTKVDKVYTLSTVECDGDKAIGTPSLGFPNNQPPTSSQWTSNSANSYWTNGGSLQQYTFYSGNYLNYLGSATTTYEGTRLTVMQDAINKLVDSSSGINVGLMRYDVFASGGMVTFPLSGLDSTTRTAIKNTVNSYKAAGNTPLSETLYEAMLYYSGGDVKFGETSNAPDSSGNIVSSPSVAGSRVGNSINSTKYQSPMVASCQKNYIVYLTDGLPTADVDINSLALTLPNFSTLGGTCDSANSNSPNGICLGALARYLNHQDFSTALSDTQNVSSYFIGFGDDFAGTGGATAFKYLQDAAKGGGGQAYTATSAPDLSSKLSATLTDIITRNSSLTAPGVAVNNFNRTTTFNDLYFSVFSPTTATHWPGNVKKYRLSGGIIVDQNGANAIDIKTGFFDHSALSFWTAGDPDGANAQLADGAGDGDVSSAGGAAHRIPIPANRNVYTYLGTNKPSMPVTLSASANHLAVSNADITGAALGDSTLTPTDRDALINWARGQDIDDKDNPNKDTTDKRSVMGAPLHSRPAVLVYGGTSDDPDSVIFATTNDGYLHAIGGKDNDGTELWSFIPKEMIGDIKLLHDNPVTSTTHYSLDGDVVLYKDDVNGNGIIDPGTDKVILIVGRGRGGSNYYALDVTSKTEPKFLWSLSASDLPGLGEAWSTPVITRVKVGSATQNTKKSVLIFAGGYDSQQETPAYRSDDSVGNKLFMVDTLTGNLLWSAGASGADLNISRMTHSIPSDVSVLDVDSDGYADRMYVGDMGGQILRFDIFNSEPRSTLVTGGVIASLGAHDEGTPTDATNRRFYAAPSVAAYTPVGGTTFFNLAIGSGYRGHPLNKATEDRIYGIRDKEPFKKYSQKDFDDLMANTTAGQGIIKDDELSDVTNYPTTVPLSKRGWKLPLNQPSWQGEKVLSKALTLEGVVIIPSYIPSTGSVKSEDGCSTATTGSNRLYAISLYDGSPVKPKGDSYTKACTEKSCTATDRYDDLAQGGIAPNPILLFTQIKKPSDSSSSDSSGSSSSSSSEDPLCGSIATIAVGTATSCSPLKNPLFRASFKQDER